VELILIWAFLAIVCAIIANNKNRFPVGWFFAGIIGGIFAVVIVALLPKVEAV
jgi:hypothetical protein